MSKFLKITTISAVFVACSSSFAGDLSKEKGVVCAGFYDNVEALADSHGDKMMGMKKYKYMMDNAEKYGEKMGVSAAALNSATTRAKDVELGPLKLAYADLKSKVEAGKVSDSETGGLILKYFKAREKKLGC